MTRLSLAALAALWAARKKMGAKKLRGKIIEGKIMVIVANVRWGQNTSGI
jgi:hypothetical protein